MTWEYRILRRETIYGEEYFEIHPVFDGKSWSKDPETPIGDTPEDLKNDLKRMLKAFDKPILIETGDNLKNYEQK